MNLSSGDSQDSAPTAEKGAAKRVLLWPSSSRVEYSEVPLGVEESFQRDFPQVEMVVARSREQVELHLARCEILVSWKVSPEDFTRCRELRWIHSPMAGVTQMLFPELVSSAVLLTNGSTVHALPVAEQAFALMLAVARKLPNCFRFQAERRWGQEESWQPGQVPFELHGRTLGVVGLGAIGREVAQRARAFGMRVVAVKHDPARGAELADRVYAPGQLHELLAASDFVVLCAPDTPQTARLISQPELERMKPEAYLINVSRGTLVDTAALVEALRSQRIAGAGLDVTDPEPLPPEHPLWELPGVVITPHLGGASTLFWPRQAEQLRQNLRRYLAGQPLLNVVDKARGY